MSGEESSLDLEALFNPDEQMRFRRLCLETSREELIELGTVVTLHLDWIKENAAPATDLEMAERIAGSLQGLLQADLEFEHEERSLIRGAVEYFLLADDASGDLEEALGFDDDARVVNSVMTRIGRPEFAIDLD